MKIVNKLWVQPVFNISRHNENVMYETELILDSLMNSLLLCALVGCIWNKWAWRMCRISIFRWLASLRSCWGFGLNGHQGFHPLGAAQEPLHSCGLGWLGNNGSFQAISRVLVEHHVYVHGNLDVPVFLLSHKRQHILGEVYNMSTVSILAVW